MLENETVGVVVARIDRALFLVASEVTGAGGLATASVFEV